MNNRKKIDITTWNRYELFQEFINMRTSIYDILKTVDVVATGISKDLKRRF